MERQKWKVTRELRELVELYRASGRQRSRGRERKVKVKVKEGSQERALEREWIRASKGAHGRLEKKRRSVYAGSDL